MVEVRKLFFDFYCISLESSLDDKDCPLLKKMDSIVTKH